MENFCGKWIILVAFICTCLREAQCISCPDGWMPHHQSCYLFMKETYNWFDAKAVCEELGGMLAEIADQDENNYLVGMTHDHNVNGGYTWIGLQDFLEEGNFVWTHSKQPATPSFWNHGEPQDKNGEEDCGAIHAAGWIDTNCEDGHCTAICERAGSGGGIIG